VHATVRVGSSTFKTRALPAASTVSWQETGYLYIRCVFQSQKRGFLAVRLSHCPLQPVSICPYTMLPGFNSSDAVCRTHPLTSRGVV